MLSDRRVACRKSPETTLPKQGVVEGGGCDPNVAKQRWGDLCASYHCLLSELQAYKIHFFKVGRCLRRRLEVVLWCPSSTRTYKSSQTD